MKYPLLALLLGTTALPAGTLILSDNFNAPDNANFDNSEQAGRRSGLLGPDVQLRSSRIQHSLSNNQLLFNPIAEGSGRIRFHLAADLGTWADFATGISGTTMLAQGGMRIAFDWIPADNTSDNWISFSAGIDGQSAGEPLVRVNDPGTDFGILFRNAGGTQFFRNGPASATTGGAFPVDSVATRKVVITYAFTSFEDGSDVVVRATVDGTDVLPSDYTFQWAGNGGTQMMEFGNLAAGSRIDNFTISGLNGLTAFLDAQPFYTSIANDGTVGTFSSLADEVPEPATYSLVAGDGDFDNGKFKITGDLLQSNGFSFLGLPDNAPLSVRVRSTGTTTGLTVDQAFQLTVIADDDQDDLPDTWELSIAGIDDLNGRLTGPGPGANTGDFDGDGLTDLQEFNFIRGLYPALNPLAADTDFDGLNDGAEINPTAPRVATSPTDEDSDNDGLDDFVESNSGTFTNAGSPGTNPLLFDTDGDQFPDNYEIARNTSPVDPAQLPALSAPLTTAILTTDETSGISPSKNYTHAISGGTGVNINGVAFEALKPAPAAAPSGFT